MPYRRNSFHRRSLALAVHLALFTGLAHAADADDPKPFPAYLDGYLVPSEDGLVHHVEDQLDADLQQVAQRFCASNASWQSCTMKGHALREKTGSSEKRSAYSVLDITFDIVDASGQPGQRTTSGNILAVRSCPADAMLIDDYQGLVDNRDPATGREPVACVSPDSLPKGASLGVPEESGANQCPIGNSSTVGNPINPLTMSKIEAVVDYTGPSASGLIFGRTYHSGAFSLAMDYHEPLARYPAGARIGARWRHSWDRQFVRRPYYDASGSIYATALHLVREDGNETRFVKKGDTFVSADGARGTLREHPEGGWMYTLPDLTVERYDDTGRLRSRTDANGNEITLHYDDITVGIGLKASVLVRVTDRQGRELRLGYDRLGRVETVDTPDGRINYSYSGGILDGLDADLLSVKYPDGRRIGYHYDEPAMGGTPNHKLTGIVGADGKRFATFQYDEYNRAIRSAHGDDLEWTEVSSYSWGEVAIHTKEERFAEQWYTVFDQGQIRLGERKDSSDAVRRFDYLGAGLVSRQTDYLDVPTTYRYDRSRRLEVERIEAEGTPVARTVKTTWHPVIDKPTRIDQGTQWVTFDYDAKGNLVEQREGGSADAADAGGSPWPDERITRYSYDAAGRLLTVDGPLAGTDDTTRYTYYDTDAPGCAVEGGTCTWRKGDLHTITNALGHTDTVLAYDAAGRVLSSTDANGVRTDRRYDAAGRPLEVTVRVNRDGTASTGDLVRRMTYTANGDLDVLTDPDGVTLTHRYNAAHRLVEQIDAVGNRRLVEPDGEGRIQTETWRRADGTDDGVWTFGYTSRGFLHRLSHNDGTSVTYERDAEGRLIQARGDIQSLTFQHDARGRVERLSESRDKNDGETLLSYDGTDRVKTVVDPKGLSTSYLRNGLGDLLWQRSPDTGDTAFENDAHGQPLKETPADHRSVDRAYDRLGRLTRVTYSDGQVTNYSYDTPSAACMARADFAVGRLTSVTESSGTTTFCYDIAGRVVQKVQVANGIHLGLHYAYTKAGRLSTLTYPDGRQVSYQRDATGRIAHVETHALLRASHPVLTEIRHDALGRVIHWTAGGRTLSRAYNGLNNVTAVRDDRADGLKLGLTYDYGSIDEIKTDRATISAITDWGQRITDTSTFGGGSFGGEFYRYDGTGNRLSWTTLLTNRRYEYAPDSHHLLIANKVPREYDATGNTTKIGEREFVYDATGRMTQAKVNGVVERNYAYNAFGQQVAKSIAGTTTVSLHDEAGHWLGDYDGAGRPIRQMVWLDNLPVAALDGDAIRDIQPDHLGTPRVVIDRATDKAIWTWPITGEAFGTTAPNEDPDKDGTKYVFDMRFPGQRYDAVTGLFQNGWRDYDPTSGRYIQSDPIGLAGGISTYAYVGSNPYTHVDPTGLVVQATFYRGDGILQVYDLDRPDVVYQVIAQSGGRFQPDGSFFSRPNKTIPVGDYQILSHNNNEWFRLDPLDSYPLNDVHEATGRDAFRLHPGQNSVGCVTVNANSDQGKFYSEEIAPIIRNTRSVQTTDYARRTLSGGYIPYNYRYGAPFKEPITFYGNLKVLP